MSDKSKICAIGEKKLIGGKWYEKAELEGGSYACAGCAFVHTRIDCDARQNTAVEDGGYECIDSIWIACDQPQPETPAVEECAGCRFWKALDQFQQTGDCRRYPPIQRIGEKKLIGGKWYEKAERLAEFPETRRDMWCGEWKP